MTVKFLKKGIRDAAGKYYPCWYSHSTLIDGREAITIYARSHGCGLPRELHPQNDSDGMTDYFETDRVRFFPGSPEFDTLKPMAKGGAK